LTLILTFLEGVVIVCVVPCKAGPMRSSSRSGPAPEALRGDPALTDAWDDGVRMDGSELSAYALT